jgi:hypothetical protein
MAAPKEAARAALAGWHAAADRFLSALESDVNSWISSSVVVEEQVSVFAEALPFAASCDPDRALRLLARAAGAALPSARILPLLAALPRMGLPPEATLEGALACAACPDALIDRSPAATRAPQLDDAHAHAAPIMLAALAALPRPRGTLQHERYARVAWTTLLAPGTPEARARAAPFREHVANSAFRARVTEFFDALDARVARLARLTWIAESWRPQAALRKTQGASAEAFARLQGLLSAWADD